MKDYNEIKQDRHRESMWIKQAMQAVAWPDPSSRLRTRVLQAIEGQEETLVPLLPLASSQTSFKMGLFGGSWLPSLLVTGFLAGVVVAGVLPQTVLSSDGKDDPFSLYTGGGGVTLLVQMIDSQMN